MSFILALAAVATALLPPICGWPPWGAAEVYVSLFGVLATVVAILAAYLELNLVLDVTAPRQELSVDLVEQNDGWHVRFRNDTEGTMISAYRLHVRFLDENGEASYDGISSPYEAGFDSPWERALDPEAGYAYHEWSRVSTNPFFPGTSEVAPNRSAWHRTGVWVARWHTDRAFGEERLPVPPP